MKTIWFNNETLKELLADNGIEMTCDENMNIVISDEDAERIPALVEELAPYASNDYGIEPLIKPLYDLAELMFN